MDEYRVFAIACLDLRQSCLSQKVKFKGEGSFLYKQSIFSILYEVVVESATEKSLVKRGELG